MHQVLPNMKTRLPPRLFDARDVADAFVPQGVPFGHGHEGRRQASEGGGRQGSHPGIRPVAEPAGKTLGSGQKRCLRMLQVGGQFIIHGESGVHQGLAAGLYSAVVPQGLAEGGGQVPAGTVTDHGNAQTGLRQQAPGGVEGAAHRPECRARPLGCLPRRWGRGVLALAGSPRR